MNKKAIPNQSEIIFYTSPDGDIKIEVFFRDDNVWLTQKLMARLFDVDRTVITKHLSNIFKEREVEENSVSAFFAHTAKDGKTYRTKFYSLEAIIAVGYRVNSQRGTQFRIWATDKLKNYILKGFAVDKDRFIKGTRFDARSFDELLEEIREIRASERMAYQKITDIYATAIDYSPNTLDAEKFFATVQNKLHFAITGKTTAEIIAKRADSTKPFMGLTTWRKSPKGKIFPSDTAIAKNYLQKEEIKNLNHIVDMYLDYAELQASRGRAMSMQDWKEKLDAFLKFNEMDILQNAGKVSHEVVVALAEKEYKRFRIKQDRQFESDFDRLAKKLLKKIKK